VESIGSFGRDAEAVRGWRRDKSPRAVDRARCATGVVGRLCMEVGKGG
jgi:hypothetical protein